jgi:long-chain acyl-CoA synthetase
MRGSILEYLSDRAEDGNAAFRFRPKLRTRVTTYREIAQTAFQFARELEGRGVRRGDRVVIWAGNSPDWVAVFFGIVARGAIAVPLDEQSAPDFARRVCENTDPKLVLCGRDVDRSALSIPLIELTELREIIRDHSAEPFFNENLKADDTVEIVFTSGTTSEPKGVVLTHENLLANLEPMEREIRKYIKWKFLVDPIKILCLLPLSHIFGQMMGIFIPSILRAEVIFQSRLDPAETIDTIKREHVMILATVPRVLDGLKNKIERNIDGARRLDDFRRELEKPRSWRRAWLRFNRIHRLFGLKFICFVTGGAELNESTENFWRKLGFAVAQGYGMTETAALVSINNPFSSRRRSLGQILAGRENVKLSEKGEILVRGKNISPGYWGETERRHDEWLNTGDIGSLDKTGRLYFRGRSKEVIVTSAGLNIYPADLEAALNAQSEIIDSTVVGVDLGSGAEPVAALIVPPGSNPDRAVARANERLADFQRIRRWFEWPEPDFPRTSTHKVRRSAIAKVLRQQFVQKETSVAYKPALAELVSKFGGNGKKLDARARLSDDLGLDSLSRVELLAAIEDRYQISLDDQALGESATMADVERMIRERATVSADAAPFRYPRWPLRFPISWIRPIFYELVIYPITRFLGPVLVEGAENLDGVEGPVILASNHVTYIDPALIVSAMPRRFRRKLAIAMHGERLRAYLHPPTGTSLWSRVRGFFTYWLVITFFNAFPLPKASGYRRSFDFAGEAVDIGYNLLIFPEGELTKDGSIQPFKSGIGLLADGLQIPVVPVLITGLYELQKAGQRGSFSKGLVTIRFGRPILLDRERPIELITSDVEAAVRSLDSE